MFPAVTTRVLFLLLAATVAAGPLPDLFQKAKEQFKLGSYSQALATIDVLEKESQANGQEQARAALLPGLLFYRGACLAGLGRPEEARREFEAFLAYQPDAELDPGTYPKRVIAAFEEARRSSRKRPELPEGGGALAIAYRAFSRPGSEPAENSNTDWADGPVRWLLTPGERRDYSSRADSVSRSEFVTSFWKSRDAKAETPENEFREEFEKRVAFSDARFTDDEVRGSLTDRGMVFILLGPPSYSGRKPLRTGDDAADASGLSRYTRSEVRVAAGSGGSPSERVARIDKVDGPGTKVSEGSNWIEGWHYLRADLPREVPFPEVQFHFVTKQGYGRNVLQRETQALTTLDRAKSTSTRH